MATKRASVDIPMCIFDKMSDDCGKSKKYPSKQFLIVSLLQKHYENDEAKSETVEDVKEDVQKENSTSDFKSRYFDEKKS